MSSTSFVIAVLLIMVGRIVYKTLFPRPRFEEDMKRKFVFEVIKLVQEAKRRSDKVSILHTNMGPGLAGILRLNFDATLELDVDLDMPYMARKEMDALDTLNHSSKVWSTFTKQSQIAQVRKNLRFKAMLESLEPREAELFIKAAKRELKLGLSKMTITKCLPQVFKNNS
jgi:hypothetical protein